MTSRPRLARRGSTICATSGRGGLVAYVTAGDPDRSRSARGARRGRPRRRRCHRGRRAVLGSARRRSRDPARQRAGAGRRHDAARIARAGPRVPPVASRRRSCCSPTRIRSSEWMPATFARRSEGRRRRRRADARLSGRGGRAAAGAAGRRRARSDIPDQPDDDRRADQALGASWARGFLYVISRLGVTGTRDALAGDVVPLLARVRAQAALPVAVGLRHFAAGARRRRRAGMPMPRSSAARWSRRSPRMPTRRISASAWRNTSHG